jgi:hypothetical protein
VTGPNTALLEGTADVVFTGLVTNGITTTNVDTGVLATRTMWLNGFGLTGTSGGIPAVLGVYVSTSPTNWLAYVNAASITTGPTDTTVRIYYTYTA